MDLVVHQVVKFHHVHIANRDRAFEPLAGPSVIQEALSRFGKFGLFQECLDLTLGRAFEDRTRHPETEGFGGPAQMRLEDLPDIHA